MSQQLYERLTLDAQANVRRTPDGYLAAMPRVARVGIQLYRGYELGRPEVDVVRAFRPEAEVFHKDSLHTYTHRTVTNDHPKVLVDSTNWKKFAVGHTGDEVARDGEYIRVPMVLMDAAVIRDYENGKRELSLGYTMDVKWEPGKAPNGEDYDAVIGNIRANHLAVVAAARGGSELTIGDDEGDRTMPEVKTKTIMLGDTEVEVADVAASTILRYAKNLETQIVDLRGKLEKEAEKSKDSEEEAKKSKAKDEAIAAKDAEIAGLKKRVEDAEVATKPEALDRMVKDRAEVIAKSKIMVGDKLVVDGKSASEIRRAVVDAQLGDTARGYTDDQVTIAFNALSKDAKPSAADPLRTAIQDGHGRPPVAGGNPYQAYDASLTGAWSRQNRQQSAT